MVHIGDMPAPLGDVLDLLRPGDIMTHTYTSFARMDSPDGGKTIDKLYHIPMGTGQTVLDADGKIIPQALAARERGVLFDVGHGMGSFSFAVAGPAVEQGFVPDTIGSDLHAGSIDGPVFDLPSVMSRFLSLGQSLAQVIEATTSRPAHILGMGDEIGTLKAGAVADVSVLDLLGGGFEFRDSAGNVQCGEEKLQAAFTVRAGEIIEA